MNILQPWWQDGRVPMVNGVVDSAGNVTPIDFRNKEVKRHASLTLAAHLKMEPHAWEVDETARATFDEVEVIVGGGPMGGDGFVVLLRNQKVRWMLVSERVNPLISVTRLAGNDGELRVTNNCGDVLCIPLHDPTDACWLAE